MEQYVLVRPAIAHSEEITAYRKEFLDAGDSMDGTGPLRRMEQPQAYILGITTRCKHP